MNKIIRVGSRESALAMKQTEWVVARLRKAHPGMGFEIVGIKTKGDKILDVSLAKIGGKGLFTKEIETALLEGRVDLAVHSLKDVPTVLPEGLALLAITEREDPRDVLVSPRGKSLGTLRRSARLGTSSLRRAAQLKNYRPDLEIVSVRGNLVTRLKKMEEEGLDGLVLAAAGLQRMGWGDRITERLPEAICLPAAGQGALAIEGRSDDEIVAKLVSVLHHADTAIAVTAERGFLRKLGGGCQVPIGALARCAEGRVRIFGVVADVDGVEIVRGEKEGPVEKAEAIGVELGAELLAHGARGILARVEAATPATTVSVDTKAEAAVASAPAPSPPPAPAPGAAPTPPSPPPSSAPSPSSSKGIVYLIGAGPGDPGLLTVKGRECLEKAEVVVFDRLVNPRLLRHCRPDAEYIYVGKGPDRHTLRQEEINQVLVEKAAEGRLVARLKGGDPFVFGRGGEEAEELRAHGLRFEVVPGVTSAIAVPAYAGIPVTHRDFTSSLTIVTGHEDPEKNDSAIDWRALGSGVGTLVFLMGTRNLPTIARNLVQSGRPPETPVAVIRWGTWPGQRTVTGTLADIAAVVERAGLTNPAIIIVGQVVGLRDQLSWFENRPLFGHRILTTRTRPQASALTDGLAALGAEVVEYPLIAIMPPSDFGSLDRGLAALDEHIFDWLVFSSQNGVDAFFDRLVSSGRDLRVLAGVKLCAVGPATAENISRRGLHVDLVPDEYNADGALAAMLTATEHVGRRILVARAEEGRDVLIDGLRMAGRDVGVAVVYRTVPAGAEPGSLPAWLHPLPELLREERPDLVTFTSSSTVRNFVDLIPPEDLKGLLDGVAIACIGPVTAQTATACGLRVDAMPAKATIPDLIEAVVGHFARRKE